MWFYQWCHLGERSSILHNLIHVTNLSGLQRGFSVVSTCCHVSRFYQWQPSDIRKTMVF